MSSSLVFARSQIDFILIIEDKGSSPIVLLLTLIFRVEHVLSAALNLLLPHLHITDEGRKNKIKEGEVQGPSTMEIYHFQNEL